MSRCNSNTSLETGCPAVTLNTSLQTGCPAVTLNTSLETGCLAITLNHIRNYIKSLYNTIHIQCCTTLRLLVLSSLLPFMHAQKKPTNLYLIPYSKK
jgi:hypothetical protein